MISSTTSILILSFIAAAAVAAATEQDLVQDFLDAHNRARAEVGVQPIAWNDTVADYALQYAEERSGDCQMEHSQGPYGENLAAGWGQLSAVDAVGMWVGEKPYYDYASNACVGEECLHYTQVVWRDSTHLGCARMQCHNGWMFVTCNYDPPGNYIGQRPF